MSKRNFPDEESQRILVLLKLDAKRLFERIRERELEYLHIFSVKRTREHFKEIFFSRYWDFPLSELKKCGQEVIVNLDSFYSLVEQMQWYLNHTEAMPSTVEDNVKTYINKLEKAHDILTLYLNAELGIGDETVDENKEELLEKIDDEDDEFLTGEFEVNSTESLDSDE